MRWLSVISIALFMACKGDPEPARVTPEPSASATAAPSESPVATASASESAAASAAASATPPTSAPARVACGNTTCDPTQYCLHYDSGAGGAYSPNKRHADATTCSDYVPHAGGMICQQPNAARQAACSALIPRAAPHGNLPPPT